jgi:hypothetical protein
MNNPRAKRPRVASKHSQDSECEWLKDHGPILVSDLRPVELQTIFNNLVDQLQNMEDDIEPPHVSYYRKELDDVELAEELQGMQWSDIRCLDDYESEIVENAKVLLNTIKREVTEHPILARVVNRDRYPLISFLQTELGRSYHLQGEEYEFQDHLYDYFSHHTLKPATKFLIEQNPYVLHYEMDKDGTWRDGYVISSLASRRGVFRDPYWIAKNYPFAFTDLPPGAKALPKCPHYDVIYKAVQSGDIEFLKDFYTTRYSQNLSEIDCGYGDTALHACASVLEPSNQVQIFEWMVSEYPEGGMVQNDKGETPLHVMCEQVSFYSDEDESRIAQTIESIKFLAKTFPDSLLAPDNDGRVLLFVLCYTIANFLSHPALISKFYPLVCLIMELCPKASQIRHNGGALAVDKLVPATHFPAVRDLMAPILRSTYPLTSSFPDAFIGTVQELVWDQARYAKMGYRLKTAKSIFRKFQDEGGSKLKFMSAEEADHKMKGCEAFVSWSESQLVKVNGKIKSIDEVDIARVKVSPP